MNMPLETLSFFPFCPQPPRWEMDWDGILAGFEMVRVMAGVSQEARYHAEGDVLTHTRMVCEALAMLPAWRDLAPTDRATLFAAALFHDSGKPGRTRTEEGRITSPGHSRLSAALAREYFWNAGAPLAQRETVASLVRSHGLPLQFLDRENADRALIEFSLRGRNDFLALLAEADVRGRVCEDQPDLLTRVELFREQAQTLDCWAAPRAFPSDHSRFRYFQKPGADPSYHAYDDTVCEVVLLSGLPGAGKDTWIETNLRGWPVVSLDSLRAEMRVSPKADQAAVVGEARKRARALLRERQSFVWNATNITRQLRQPLIEDLASYRARIRIVYLESPWSELVQRNAARPDSVPGPVLEKMRWRLEVPDLTEAHQVEWLT